MTCPRHGPRPPSRRTWERGARHLTTRVVSDRRPWSPTSYPLPSNLQRSSTAQNPPPPLSPLASSHESRTILLTGSHKRSTAYAGLSVNLWMLGDRLIGAALLRVTKVLDCLSLLVLGDLPLPEAEEAHHEYERSADAEKDEVVQGSLPVRNLRGKISGTSISTGDFRKAGPDGSKIYQPGEKLPTGRTISGHLRWLRTTYHHIFS